MPPDHYILDDNNRPVATEMGAARRWSEESPTRRIVAQTQLDGCWVSTVFLTLDQAWKPGPPVLFETMIFPDDSTLENDCERYTSWPDAEAGHAAMVERWRSGQPQDPDDDHHPQETGPEQPG